MKFLFSMLILKAIALAARLRAFHYADEDQLNQKALGLAFEIHLAPPIVTACGFFDVNLSLVPAVSRHLLIIGSSNNDLRKNIPFFLFCSFLVPFLLTSSFCSNSRRLTEYKFCITCEQEFYLEML